MRKAITVNAGVDLTFCLNDNAVDLSNDPSIRGGDWSGFGINSQTFTPFDAGVGSHTITYVVSDEFSCLATDIRTFVVIAPPKVSAGPDISICQGAAPIDLTLDAFPTGGEYVGSGVIKNVFYPQIVGPGENVLSYVYNDVNLCTSIAIRTITIMALPVIDAGADFELCVNAAPIALQAATSQEGSWSGSGLIAGNFDPLSAGVGQHYLYFSFTNNAGCFSKDSLSVVVLDVPELTIGAGLSVCLSDNPIDLLVDTNINGGTFNGAGITGNVFNPTEAQPGTHIISYTVRYHGCELYAFRSITVNEPEIINIGDDIILCIDSDSYSLLQDVDVFGGEFSGSGVEENTFSAQITGIGSHLITYEYINAFNCTTTQTRVITVQEEIVIYSGEDLTLCNSVSSLDLSGMGNPTGGVYVGDGMLNDLFTPASAGVGEHIITYVVDNGNGCISNDALLITVKESPINDFGEDIIVCLTADPISLNSTDELIGG